MACKKTEKQSHLDITFVSENEHNIENASHRAAFKLNEYYSQSLLNGKLEAKQMDNIRRDSLEIKQSESFLSGLNDSIPKNGYLSTNGIKDKSKKDLCREFDSKHEQASTTSEEFSNSTPPRKKKKNGAKRKKFRKCNVEDSNCGNGSNVDGSDSEILDMSEINLPHKRRKNNSKNVSSENLLKKKEKQDTEVKLGSGILTKATFDEQDNLTSLVVDLTNDLEVIEGNQQYQPQKKKKKNKRKKNNGESSNCSNILDVNGSYSETHNDSDILLKASLKKEKSSKASNFESNDKLKNLGNITEEANKSSVEHSSDYTDLIPSSIDVCRANIKIEKEKKNVHRRKPKVGSSERQLSPSLNKSESNTSLHLKTPGKEIKAEVDVSAQSDEVEKSCDIFDQTFSGQADSKDVTKNDTSASFSEDDEFSIDIKDNPLREDSSSSCPDVALKMFFRERHFELDFKVPKLHKIVDRASRPTLSQQRRIAEKGIQVKLGKFNKSEDKQILENWKSFIQVYGFQDDPRMFFCLDKQQITAEAKKTFLFHLARGMPERTPYSVFNRFKLTMSRLLKGRFSKEEDDYIANAMQSKEKTSVTEIAKRLNRSLIAVSTHMSKLRNAHTRKIKWRGKNAASFIKYLLKVTKINEKNIDKLKNRKISTEEWRKLSRKLDDVPVRILKPIWLCRLHPALFIPGSSCDLSQIKMKLVKSLYENDETTWASVDWNKYVQQFEGFTCLRLYMILKQLVNSQVPEKKRGNLKKCLKHLMANKVHIALQSSQTLYKIKYANGEIEEMKPNAE